MPTRKPIEIGTRFARLVVTRPSPRHRNLYSVECLCDCGKTTEATEVALRNQWKQSCGCLKYDTDKAKLKYDYTGERIGRLVVIEQTAPRFQPNSISERRPSGQWARMWRVKCDCGVERIIQTQSLKKHKLSGLGSCGCWSNERNRQERQKRIKPYAFYITRMKNSARDRKVEVSISYDDLLTLIPENGIGDCHYCGIGIQWLKYEVAKSKPNRFCGHNFDRKDNDAGYSVENLLPCCGQCNRTRGDRFSYEEFMLLAPTIRAIREKRNQQKPCPPSETQPSQPI